MAVLINFVLENIENIISKVSVIGTQTFGILMAFQWLRVNN